MLLLLVASLLTLLSTRVSGQGLRTASLTRLPAIKLRASPTITRFPPTLIPANSNSFSSYSSYASNLPTNQVNARRHEESEGIYSGSDNVDVVLLKNIYPQLPLEEKGDYEASEKWLDQAAKYDENLNEVNDNATRATMLWRAMANKYPSVAAKAAMIWRIRAVRDSALAAKEAMLARKMIAADPEKMAAIACAGLSENRLQKRDSETAATSAYGLPPYWLEFAAHDPEVTARSAMYWINDEHANMYW